MKPVDQTKFGDTEGNCMAACFASILEVPIEGIELEETENWFKDVNMWLQREHGLAFFQVDKLPYFFQGYFMVGGPGPRGVEHACVGHMKEGRVEICHDPHPSREGLLEITEVFAFVKAD